MIILLFMLRLYGISWHLKQTSPDTPLLSLKGLMVSFFIHIPNNVFVFIIMVTVHGGSKPHRLGAEIHRERGKNLWEGRERDFSAWSKVFQSSWSCLWPRSFVTAFWPRGKLLKKTHIVLRSSLVEQTLTEVQLSSFPVIFFFCFSYITTEELLASEEGLSSVELAN